MNIFLSNTERVIYIIILFIPRIIQQLYSYRNIINYYRREGFINSFLKAISILGAGKTLLTPKEIKSYDMIYVIGCWEGTAKRYRVYDRVRYLESCGFNILIIQTKDIPKITSGIYITSIVIFFRCTYDQPFYKKFFKFTRENNIQTVWDVDDLIFEPKYFELMRGANQLNDDSKRRHVKDLHNYQKMLKNVNLAIFSTNTLKDIGLYHQKNSFVCENGFDEISLETSKKILSKNKTFQKDKSIYIGYFSGTKTHNIDFLECEEALLNIIREYDSVKFVLGGHLDLSNKWEQYKDRVIKLEFVNYHHQLGYLSQVDINLAPLESNNIFCEAKSNLKYYEAALVKTPTIASPTEPYSSSIVNYKSGVLANSSREWFDAMSLLIKDDALRESIGNEAHKYCIENYNQDYLGERYLNILKNNTERFPKPSDNKKNKKSLRVAFIVDGLPTNSGGHRNIFRIASQLNRHDIEVTFYMKNENHRTLKSLSIDIKKHFYDFKFDIHHLDSIPTNQDILFGTYYETIYDCLRFKGNISEIYYLVQDLEYFFNPMSSGYIRAENTYKYNFKTITSGPLPKKILSEKYNNDCIESFQFPIDRDVYFNHEKTQRKKQIIFFAKPEMPRRCYEMGLEVFETLNKKLPNYELILFGSKHIPYSDSIKYKSLKVLPSINDLASLYRQSTLGIVFSTTNPSLVPYEMMACGLPVVDMKLEHSESNYGDSIENAFLFSSIPEKMAEEIISVINDEKILKNRASKSLKFVNNFPTEDEVGDIVASFIKNSFYENNTTFEVAENSKALSWKK